MGYRHLRQHVVREEPNNDGKPIDATDQKDKGKTVATIRNKVDVRKFSNLKGEIKPPRTRDLAPIYRRSVHI